MSNLRAQRGVPTVAPRLRTQLSVCGNCIEKSTVDLKAALVMHRAGARETLSPARSRCCRLFLANPGKVLTRDDIMAAAPAESADAFDRSMNSRIVRLRRKLDTERITTIRGTGYRFDPPAGASRTRRMLRAARRRTGFGRPRHLADRK